jgi:hypothetical protein
MKKQSRISVRLDERRTALVERLRRENGCCTSEIVKRALDQLAAASSSVPSHRSITTSTATARPGSVPLSNPPKHQELLDLYRASGGQVWQERRKLFHRLFAAAGAAMEHQNNPRDFHLLIELSTLGRKYALLD